MTLSVLPIQQNINQTFTCNLSIDSQNRQFEFVFEWNPIRDYWQLSVTDQVSGLEIINHQPICQIDFPYNNIISRYSYKKIGSLYVVNLSGNKERPTYENLASDFAIVWGDTPDATVS